MNVRELQWCKIEFEKLSAGFGLPRLHRTKLMAHTVKPMKKIQPKTMKPAQPDVMSKIMNRPEIKVGPVGEVGRTIQPPPIRS